MAGRTRTVSINGAFLPQKITGQQRYATEIARLLEGRDEIRIVRPTGWFAASSVRTWLWVLIVLPVITRNDVLISMTSRAPLLHPRHVVVVHDLFVLTNPEWFSRKYVLSHAPILRVQLRSARTVVAVSEPVARQVARRTGRDPVLVAPNAASAVFARRADERLLDRWSLTAGRYLVAVGSLDPRKNLGRLIRAYAQLPADERARTPLVLVGSGDAIFRAEELEAPEGLLSTGYVSDDELAALYAGARGVVFVSLAEGFGLPLIEAAAAGATRLVLSDIEVFRWIAGDGAAYVEPTDEAAITAALQRVCSGDDLPAVEVRPDRFTWTRSAEIVGRAAGLPEAPRSTALRVAVVLATAGRPHLVERILADCLAQTSPPSVVVLAVPDDASLPGSPLPEGVRVVYRSGGLAAQRNAGIAAVGDADAVFFFDDDALVRADYLERGAAFLLAHPEVAGLTGDVLLDGAAGSEISIADGDAALEASVTEPRDGWRPTRELYGCNFGYRTAAAPGIGFDAALPAYSWLEDHDFARRLMRFGSLAHVDGCVIVHRGTKSGGRQAHRRLGYSQMMNPAYLWRKGSFPAWLAVWEVFRPCAKNVVGSIAGGEREWRRERLSGNGSAFLDIVRGRFTPGRSTSF